MRPSPAVSTLSEVQSVSLFLPPCRLTASTPMAVTSSFVVEWAHLCLLQAWARRTRSNSSRLRGQTLGVSSRSRRSVFFFCERHFRRMPQSFALPSSSSPCTSSVAYACYPHETRRSHLYGCCRVLSRIRSWLWDGNILGYVVEVFR